MKRTVFIITLSELSVFAYAQKQTFDVVSYTLPKGWQEQKSEAGIQLSAIDKKTSTCAVVVITKSTASSLTASENFNNDWFKFNGF